MKADALSTALMALGSDDGSALAEHKELVTLVKSLLVMTLATLGKAVCAIVGRRPIAAGC